MKKKTALYIHIPFCNSKCSYCDFYSIIPNKDIINNYVEELLVELSYYKDKDIIIDTIYLGGGTPSILPLASMERLNNYIFNNFSCDISEYTVEVNPCSSTNIKHYKDIGITRLSMGIQSLDDNILKLLSRSHNAKLALEALENAAKYFDNLSADLIIGVDNKQRADKDAIELTNFVAHISAYLLKLEEGTLLHRLHQSNEYTQASDDQLAEQYQNLYQTLKEQGLKRYEISNFCLSGYESKHNLKYWEMEEYIGIGTSAHSYFSNSRYYNKNSIADYLNGHHILNGLHIEEQTEELLESIMLGLRLEKGIDIKLLNKKFNINFIENYAKQLEKISPYVILTTDNLRIKPEYFLLQNAITLEFM